MAVAQVTVEELIARLREFPPGLRVLVEGYEHGYSDLFPDTIGRGRAVLRDEPDAGWWHGAYDEPYREDGDGEEVVVLSRVGAKDNLRRVKEAGS